MSPRAAREPPPSFGGPSPRRRWTVPWCVPAGTRRRLVPRSVGTSTSAPRIASGIVSGTSTSTLSPLRRNTRLSCTWVTTNRSPDGPPLRPGSPLPASRTREPSRTPRGGVTPEGLLGRPAPHARRDVHAVALRRAHGALAVARRARALDDGARPVAASARLGDREQALALR